MSDSVRHRRSSRNSSGGERSGFIGELWDSFWNPPSVACPKCNGTATEFYDPFFFSPMRTLTGRRRIKCTTCHFIWRPSRRGRSLWDRYRAVM